jgi:serine/threonine protein kinase
VQLDIVNRVKTAIDEMPSELPAKIISYQDVIRENGEYYLLYQGSEELQPLAEYLNKNAVNSQKLLADLQEKLELLKEDIELIKDLFPAGINAAHFWIDQEQDIYLMPEEMLHSKRSYNEFELKMPAADYFMPPEVISGKKWQLESYIFNLAAVFYYFFSGETIFSDQDNAKVLNKIQSEKILELKAIVPELSDDLNSLIMKMLAKEQSERPEINYALEELKRNSRNNKFKLNSFLERENLIDKKIVKKKRRNENIKLFFRQSWKVILFFAIIGGGFIWGLTSGSPATITADNSAEEVVNYFYQAIAAKNIGLANESADFDLGEMERMISETHVIEKMQQAYGGDPEQSAEAEAIYSLEKLKIEELSASENRHRFRANYEFNFRDREGRYSESIEDELVVEKIDGIWRITAVEGDFKEMIAGEYPWREE